MANEYAFRETQYNSTGSGTGISIVQPPSLGTIDSVFAFNSLTHKEEILPLSAGLSIASGIFTVSVWPALQSLLDGKQAHSVALDELAALGTLAPDEAIRTNSTGDYVAETPSNFLAWLGGIDSAALASALAPYVLTASLASVAFSGAYADLTGKPTIPSAQVNSDWNAVSGVSEILNKPALFNGTFAALTSKPTTLSGYGITDAYPLSGNPSGFLTGITSGQVTTALGFTPYNSTNPSNYITTSGARTAISLTTTGTSGAATYNNSTGVLNIPNYTPSSRSTSTPARALNTAFQISASQDAIVSYGVDIAATLTLTGGATGTVTLQYADNSGMSTNLVTVQSTANGNTGTLTIGLSLTQTSTGSLSGFIPAGKYVRLATANTVGTPSFTMRTAQETLLS